MKRKLEIGALVFAALLMAFVSFAFYNDIRPIALGLHEPLSSTAGHALAGYDVVSYFQGQPTLGSTAYAYQWGGTNWLFSSAENRNAFSANPEKYLPQFGGYCTKAVSTGFAVPGDPLAYLIWQDKLYIFADQEMTDEFLANPDEMISDCIEKWSNQ